LVATVALSTAAFSALPNTAEAQDMPSVADAQGDNELLAPHSMVVAEEPASAPATQATAVIVNPGDSLWAIEERLHPEAPPQQIALEVNRLYELNQDRIGGDPNLIFPGQEFLVPPALAPPAVPPAVMAEPAAPAAQPQTGWGSPLSSEEPATAAAAPAAPAASPALSAEEPVTAEPAASADLARSEGPATPVEPSTPQPVASEEPATPEQVITEPVNEPVNEPAAPSNTAPTDEETASPLAGIVEPLIAFYENHKGGERQLLGVGILVLTALVAILMAWRLPMKRSAGDPTAWGIPGGYYQEERPPAADGGVEEDHEPAPASSGAPEPTSRRGPSDPTATEESELASDGGSDESLLYPSLAARRRQERLRRIRQRTLSRPTRRAPETRERW